MEQTVKDMIQFIGNGINVNNDGIPAILKRDDFSIESLEKLSPNPMRIRQHINLKTAQSLIDYVNKFKVNGSAIFADLDSLTIKAVLDYHSSPNEAHWGDHTVKYTCPHSKDWKTWTQKDKSAMSQIEFGQFIENNIHCIASEGNVVSGSELLSMVLAFEETRKSEFKSVQRLNDGTMTLSFTNEKTGGGKTKLPEELVLGIQPFHNGDHYQVKARIRYRLKDGELLLWYELINPEKIIEDAFKSTLENLKTNIPEVDFFEGVLNN